MGLYDTVHDGRRCAQTKSLGKNLADYAPGDHAELAPTWSPERPQFRDDKALPIGDFVVEGADDAGRCFIVVRDNHIEAIVDTAPEDLPQFSYTGHPVDQMHPAYADRLASGPELPMYDPNPELDRLLNEMFTGLHAAADPASNVIAFPSTFDFGAAAEELLDGYDPVEEPGCLTCRTIREGARR